MVWSAIEGQELSLIGKRVKSVVKPARLDGYVRQPGFYRRGALVRLETPGKSRSYVAAGDGPLAGRRFFPLDGSAESIREANKAALIAIGTAEDAGDYLRFFCDCLRTDAGAAFNIVDAPPPGWAADTRLHIDVVPLKAWPAEQPGLFHARACVEHTGDLFVADFAICADGVVAMLEDRPLGREVCMSPY